MSGQSYGQSIEWFKLWRKTSAKGNEYFVGRCAGAKVIVFARQKDSDDDADFVVMLQTPNPQPAAHERCAATGIRPAATTRGAARADAR